MPAARSRVTMVASYGGRQPSRIFEPAVVGTPRVVDHVLDRDRHAGQRAELVAARPARRRPRRAAASAPSVSTCRNACTRSSTAAIRSRWAWATSTADTSRRRRVARPAARPRSAWSTVATCSAPPRPGSAGRGTGRPRRPARRRAPPSRVRHGTTTSSRSTLVSGTACEVGGMSSAATSPDLGDRLQDHVELAGEDVQLLLGDGEPRRRARCATSSREMAAMGAMRPGRRSAAGAVCVVRCRSESIVRAGRSVPTPC